LRLARVTQGSATAPVLRAALVERVMGVERLDAHCTRLPVAGGRRAAHRAPEQRRLIESLQALPIMSVGGGAVLRGAGPSDGRLQCRLAERVRPLRPRTDPDGAAHPDAAGLHDAVRRPAMVMPVRPVWEFLHPPGRAIDGCPCRAISGTQSRSGKYCGLASGNARPPGAPRTGTAFRMCRTRVCLRTDGADTIRSSSALAQFRAPHRCQPAPRGAKNAGSLNFSAKPN
jgi:hypothetical protein